MFWRKNFQIADYLRGRLDGAENCLVRELRTAAIACRRNGGIAVAALDEPISAAGITPRELVALLGTFPIEQEWNDYWSGRLKAAAARSLTEKG